VRGHSDSADKELNFTELNAVPRTLPHVPADLSSIQIETQSESFVCGPQSDVADVRISALQPATQVHRSPNSTDQQQPALTSSPAGVPDEARGYSDDCNLSVTLAGQYSHSTTEWCQPLQYFGDDPWLLSNDFDITALDASLKQTLSDWANIAPFHVDPQGIDLDNIVSTSQQSQLYTRTENQEYPRAQPGKDPDRPHSVYSECPSTPRDLDNSTDVSRREGAATVIPRYTRLLAYDTMLSSSKSSRMGSEEPSNGINVDEEYAATLSNHLQTRRCDETELSVGYLNACLSQYYARFHPIFPVVHLPTFRPNTRNNLLFLSMCSVGSLFLGAFDATEQGHRIHSRLNKAILASWETHLARGSRHSLPMVQAALIGQTFGLLSTDPSDLVLTDTFHGTMLSWARKLTSEASQGFPLKPLSGDAKTVAWKKWAHAEQIRRLMMALTVHDSELAMLFNHEPLLRQLSTLYMVPISDALFQAPSADRWCHLLDALRPTIHQALPIKTNTWVTSTMEDPCDVISISMRQSQFAAYAVLQNIAAAISESRSLGELTDDKQQLFGDCLIAWYKSFKRNTEVAKVDTFNLKTLWHCTFLTLCTDLHAIEEFVERDGSCRNGTSTEDAVGCTHSLSHLRSMMHASILQKHVENLRLSATPPIHVPRALYTAGLLWACHSRLQDATQNQHQRPEEIRNALMNLPECQEAGIVDTSHIDEVLEAYTTTSRSYNAPLFGIVELLRRLSRTSISNRFVLVLQNACRQ
jgi:hypothetical protein